MMKNISILIVIVSLGITSCIPYKEIDIQYIKEPIVQLPGIIKNPIILINLYEQKGLTEKDRFDYALDSLAAEEAANAVKENLSNSPWFENSMLPIRRYFRHDNTKYIKPLTWGEVSSVSANDSSNLIISLEYMKVDEFVDSYKTLQDGVDYFYGSLSASIYCYWRIYDIDRNKIPFGELYRDTLVWESRDWIPVKVGNQLPGHFAASAYIGGDCGDKMAKKIAPIWLNDKRLLFHIGSKEMETAALFAINGQWLEAASEWQKVLTMKNRKLCAKAAFNLALANEMLGKFDLVLEWLKKSSAYYPLPEIDNYTITIQDRINNSFK